MKVGAITICSKQFEDANHVFEIEVHHEDGEAWYGYSRINPFSAYSPFPKKAYTLVEDRRKHEA